jgi:predicted esterase
MGFIWYLASWIMPLAVWVLILVVFIVLLMVINQRRLIYVSYFPEGSRAQVLTPASFGCKPSIASKHASLDGYEIVSLTTADNVSIQAYWIPFDSIPLDQDGSKAMDEGSRPILVFFHANAGNMGHRLPIALALAKTLHCHVYLLSYRGYGHSEGSPTEKGLQLDAQCIIEDVVKRKSTTLELSQSKIFLFGQSIGSAIALYTASKYPDIVSAVFIENTFQSIPRLVPHIFPLLSKLTFLCTEKWNNLTFLQAILYHNPSMPILFLSGKLDEVVPSAHMQGLFMHGLDQLEISKNGNKSIIRSLEPKSVHNLAYVQSDTYLQTWYTTDPTSHMQFTLFKNGTHNDTCVQQGYLQTILEFSKTNDLSSVK